MWRLGKLLPRTILLVLSILAGIYTVKPAPLPGSALAWGEGIPRAGVMHAGVGRIERSPGPAGGPALHAQSANQVFMSAAAWLAAVAHLPFGSAHGAVPSVVSLTATPLRAVPLDTVTFAATLRNDGYTYGPYSATLQLLPYNGGRMRSQTQRGFMLRHNQPLTLYWERRAGTSLPCGIYAMRVQLGTVAQPSRVVASFTASQRLTIRHR